MKFLIVTSNTDWGLAISDELSDHEVKIVSQDDALTDFREFGPDLTLVSEYEDHEGLSGRWQVAVRNFHEIRSSAGDDQKVLRCGFLPLDRDDYLQLPFGSDTLLPYLE